MNSSSNIEKADSKSEKGSSKNCIYDVLKTLTAQQQAIFTQRLFETLMEKKLEITSTDPIRLKGPINVDPKRVFAIRAKAHENSSTSAEIQKLIGDSNLNWIDLYNALKDSILIWECKQTPRYVEADGTIKQRYSGFEIVIPNLSYLTNQIELLITNNEFWSKVSKVEIREKMKSSCALLLLELLNTKEAPLTISLSPEAGLSVSSLRLNFLNNWPTVKQAEQNVSVVLKFN